MGAFYLDTIGDWYKARRLPIYGFDPAAESGTTLTPRNLHKMSTATHTKEQRLQHIENEARKLREEIEAEKKANEIDITQEGVYLTKACNGEFGISLVHRNNGYRFNLDEISMSHIPDWSHKNELCGRKGLAKLTAEEVRMIVRYANRLVENR